MVSYSFTSDSVFGLFCFVRDTLDFINQRHREITDAVSQTPSTATTTMATRTTTPQPSRTVNQAPPKTSSPSGSSIEQRRMSSPLPDIFYRPTSGDHQSAVDESQQFQNSSTRYPPTFASDDSVEPGSTAATTTALAEKSETIVEHQPPQLSPDERSEEITPAPEQKQTNSTKALGKVNMRMRTTRTSRIADRTSSGPKSRPPPTGRQRVPGPTAVQFGTASRRTANVAQQPFDDGDASAKLRSGDSPFGETATVGSVAALDGPIGTTDRSDKVKLPERQKEKTRCSTAAAAAAQSKTNQSSRTADRTPVGPPPRAPPVQSLRVDPNSGQRTSVGQQSQPPAARRLPRRQPIASRPSRDTTVANATTLTAATAITTVQLPNQPSSVDPTADISPSDEHPLQTSHCTSLSPPVTIPRWLNGEAQDAARVAPSDERPVVAAALSPVQTNLAHQSRGNDGGRTLSTDENNRRIPPDESMNSTNRRDINSGVAGGSHAERGAQFCDAHPLQQTVRPELGMTVAYKIIVRLEIQEVTDPDQDFIVPPGKCSVIITGRSV